MKDLSQRKIVAAAAAMLSCASASALDINAGDYKFSVNGNINVHYIYTECSKAKDGAGAPISIVGGLACNKSGATERSSSSVSNGLLPAALTFGVATTQAGLDLAAHFGFYPGVSSNDGGSPNLQAGTGVASTNTGLATTGLDVRQVYMTFGNKDIGTVTMGRNFGLFGFDAIINDMTIPGVGAAGAAASGAPANTTLGSIGLGYIYTDTLSQINYTTPDLAGLKATLGVYDPLNPVFGGGGRKDQPGFHGKLAYSLDFDKSTKLYLSSAFITQEQRDVGAVGNNYRSYGVDGGAKLDIADLEVLGWYYYGKGMGTTALFLLSDDGAGRRRGSEGYLAQITYKIDAVKLGVNYGVSRLNLAQNDAKLTAPGPNTLVKSNSKVTGGVYYSLTKNLTVLGEVTDVTSKSYANGKNSALNFNIGTFLSF